MNINILVQRYRAILLASVSIAVFLVVIFAGTFILSVRANIPIFVVDQTGLTGTDCTDAGASTDQFCFTTIQEALDAAELEAGQVRINVNDGTYLENLTVVQGNPVILESTNGKLSTIIDGTSDITLDVYDKQFEIRGFTIKNDTINGPALYIRPTSSSEGTDMIIENNDIENPKSDSIYILDNKCNSCTNSISVNNNNILVGDGKISFYIHRVDNVIVDNNIFYVNGTGQYSKAIGLQEAKNITIVNNSFSDLNSSLPNNGAYAITLNVKANSTTQDITIDGNSFSNLVGQGSSAIYINDVSTSYDLSNVSLTNNIFNDSVSNVLLVNDNSNDATQIKLDLVDNDFGSRNSAIEREQVISHNCLDSKSIYAAQYNVSCDAEDNNGKNDFILVKYLEIAPPNFLGWNQNDGSVQASDVPVSLQCSASNNVYTNYDEISYLWTQVDGPTELAYEIKVIDPNNNVLSYIESNTYSDFKSLGGLNGVWNVQVRAFWDANLNNSIDIDEDVSEYSTQCGLIFDNISPTADIPSQPILFEEGQVVGPFVIKGYDNFDIEELCYEVSSPTNISYFDECLTGSTSEFDFNVFSQFSGNLDTSTFEEGVWSINYYLTDSAGNRSDSDNLISGNQDYAFDFEIENVAPNVILSSDQTINEGDTATFTASFTDPGSDDSDWSVEIDYGDGYTASLVNMGTPGSIVIPNHTYETDGVYTVTLTVTENDQSPGEGESGQSQVVVTVDNKAPVVQLDQGQTINEGDTASFTGSFVDYGMDDADWEVEVDYGDGNILSLSPVSTDGSVSIPDHTYLEDGVYTVILTVTESSSNGEGQSGISSVDVIVENVLPTVNFDGPITIKEGETASFLANFVDPGADDSPWNANIDYGDGTAVFDIGTLSSNGGINIPDHQYVEDGNYIVTLVVSENVAGSAGSKIETIEVIVENVEPVLSLSASPSTSVTSGSDVTINSDITGNTLPGNQIATYLWSGDCSGSQPSFTINNANGSYNCTLTVTDNDGDQAVANITISATNNVPSVVIFSSPGLSVTSGTTVTLTGSISGGDPAFSYAWSGACSGNGTTSNSSVPSTTVPNTPGSYYCRLDITDATGDNAAAGVTVVVNSQANSNTGTNNPADNGQADDNNVLGLEDQNTSEEIDNEETISEENENSYTNCSKRYSISGYVYLDKNNNSRIDSGENGIENIEISVTYEEDNQVVELGKDKTDSTGMWTLLACPGTYSVSLNADDIESEFKVLNTLILNNQRLGERNLENVNFALEDISSGMSLWWIILILILIAIIIGIIIFLGSKRKKEEENQRPQMM